MNRSDRDALLRACLANPLDDAPRLILADFLEENNWGDPLMLAALRGEGDWYVSAWGEVAYRFGLAKQLERRYAKTGLVIDYGYEWQGDGDLVFGKADHTQKCSKCDKNVGLNFKQGKWQCANDCTRPRTSYGGFSGGMMSFSAINVINSMAQPIPEDWLREQLGVPKPKEK